MHINDEKPGMLKVLPREMRSQYTHDELLGIYMLGWTYPRDYRQCPVDPGFAIVFRLGQVERLEDEKERQGEEK